MFKIVLEKIRQSQVRFIRKNHRARNWNCAASAYKGPQVTDWLTETTSCKPAAVEPRRIHSSTTLVGAARVEWQHNTTIWTTHTHTTEWYQPAGWCCTEEISFTVVLGNSNVEQLLSVLCLLLLHLLYHHHDHIHTIRIQLLKLLNLSWLQWMTTATSYLTHCGVVQTSFSHEIIACTGVLKYVVGWMLRELCQTCCVDWMRCVVLPHCSGGTYAPSDVIGDGEKRSTHAAYGGALSRNLSVFVRESLWISWLAGNRQMCAIIGELLCTCGVSCNGEFE